MILHGIGLGIAGFHLLAGNLLAHLDPFHNPRITLATHAIEHQNVAVH